MPQIILYCTVSFLTVWLSKYIFYALAHDCKLNSPGYKPFTSRYFHWDPILGIDLLVQVWREFHNGELSEGMRRRHERYGHTFLSNNMGKYCVYTIDLDNIRTVTTTNFEHYGKSAWVEEASKHIGRGVLMSEGEAWKRSRDLLKPIFSRASIDEPTLVEPHVRRLADLIRGRGKLPLDFQGLAARLNLDIVTEFLFGKPTDTLSDHDENCEGRKFLSYVKDFEPPSGTFIAIGILAWLELLPSYRRLITAVNGMKSFFQCQLENITVGSHDRPQGRGQSCLRMMQRQGLSATDIQGELQNIFFASFDTTTALLANVVGAISQHQIVQARLRVEVDSLGGKIPNRQDMAKMTYLRIVIWEALRLYSPVTSHSRQANIDTILPKGGGPQGHDAVFIPAGTTVVWSTYSLNRSPEYYGNNWAEFCPERWELLQKDNNTFFMPFGSGPRACMGQQIALAEISYVIIRLLQHFPTIKNEDLRPFKEAKAVSFYNAHGVMISMY